jgi:hypothetical protein
MPFAKVKKFLLSVSKLPSLRKLQNLRADMTIKLVVCPVACDRLLERSSENLDRWKQSARRTAAVLLPFVVVTEVVCRGGEDRRSASSSDG